MAHPNIRTWMIRLLRARRRLLPRAPLLIGLGVLALFLAGLGNHAFWGTHEPYVGGIIREMATSGDWIVPTLNGRPYLEKPPLFYAAGALCCRLFGTFAPWALRLPSALFAAATAVGCGWLGRRAGSPRAGFWAALMVATSYLFFKVGHSAIVDMALTAAVSFSLGFAYLAVIEPERRRLWIPWFWTATGCTFLAKGVFGPVVVLLPVCAALLLHRDRALIRAFLKPNWGMLAASALVLGWVLPLALRGGREFLMEVFVRNSFGRFAAHPELVSRTGRLGEHCNPFHYYALKTPGSILPWTAVWFAALWATFPRRLRAADPRLQFLPLVFGIGLLLLSIARAKRTVYVLPFLPLTLVHAALWLDSILPRHRAVADRRVRTLFGLTLAVLGLLGVGTPLLLVATHQAGWVLASALALLAALPIGVTLRLLVRERLPLAFGWTLSHWAVYLAVFTVFAVPELDRTWRPVHEPFRAARQLEARGAVVYAGNLDETFLGYASLELRHTLPGIVIDDLPGTLRLLEGRSPVAILAGDERWLRDLRGRRLVREVVFPPPRDARIVRRMPYLLVNESAFRLMEGTLSAQASPPVEVRPL